jgi:hypothetical protein
MKTNYIVGAALVAMLNCAIANADLLGGSGSLGGALGGNLNGARDVGLSGHGNGAFGADLDSRSLRRATSETTDRTKQRTRDTVSATHERAKSTAAATKSVAADKVNDAKSLEPKGAASGNASASKEKGVALDGAADAALK